MRCPRCGSDNPGSNRFCGSCGEDFQSELSSVPWADVPRPAWTKQYKFLWMTWTVHGPSDRDCVETRSSFLGVEQVTRSPRALSVGGIKLLVGFLAVVSILLMAMSLTATGDVLNFFFLLGAVFLLGSVGIGYISYRVFYVPP